MCPTKRKTRVIMKKSEATKRRKRGKCEVEQAVWNFMFGLVSSALAAFLGALVAGLKGRKARQKKWENSLMLLMRSDLIRLHDCFTKKGYCPTSVKFSVREEYEGYHSLGGNGVVTRLVEEVMALPSEEGKEGKRDEKKGDKQ